MKTNKHNFDIRKTQVENNLLLKQFFEGTDIYQIISNTELYLISPENKINKMMNFYFNSTSAILKLIALGGLTQMNDIMGFSGFNNPLGLEINNSISKNYMKIRKNHIKNSAFAISSNYQIFIPKYIIAKIDLLKNSKLTDEQKYDFVFFHELAHIISAHIKLNKNSIWKLIENTVEKRELRGKETLNSYTDFMITEFDSLISESFSDCFSAVLLATKYNDTEIIKELALIRNIEAKKANASITDSNLKIVTTFNHNTSISLENLYNEISFANHNSPLDNANKSIAPEKTIEMISNTINQSIGNYMFYFETFFSSTATDVMIKISGNEKLNENLAAICKNITDGENSAIFKNILKYRKNETKINLKEIKNIGYYPIFYLMEEFLGENNMERIKNYNSGPVLDEPPANPSFNIKNAKYHNLFENLNLLKKIKLKC